MGGTIKFDYYYGIEAEQFSFYRVPRLLIKDERFKGLSSDAKLLYGLMLDRMALSMKNGWLDDENRAYIIYTVDSIMEDLGCGKDKAIKVLAELDTNKGIGLVERIRRGLGKPDLPKKKRGSNNKICPECGRKMKQQFIGLQHCKCGMSWKKDIGYFERTGDMVFALERRKTGKKTKQCPVIRYR